MAHKYAGILGTLAMSVVLLRAVKGSGGYTSALWTSIGFMAVFALAGFVIGWIAEAVVIESVRSQFEQQVQNETNLAPQPPAKATPG